MTPDLEAACTHVAQAGLVGFPTETVWGLGADACSPRAVEALFAWKGRRADSPLSVLVTDLEAARALGAEPCARAGLLARELWPGPLTLVVPCARGVLAPGVARADGAVGLRCSPHPVAARLAQALAARGLGPLTATSLNRSGEAPARTRGEARTLCRETTDPALLAEGEACGGAPSSVLDLTGTRPVLLREGGVPASTIAARVGTLTRASTPQPAAPAGP